MKIKLKLSLTIISVVVFIMTWKDYRSLQKSISDSCYDYKSRLVIVAMATLMTPIFGDDTRLPPDRLHNLISLCAQVVRDTDAEVVVDEKENSHSAELNGNFTHLFLKFIMIHYGASDAFCLSSASNSNLLHLVHHMNNIRTKNTNPHKKITDKVNSAEVNGNFLVFNKRLQIQGRVRPILPSLHFPFISDVNEY